MQMFEIYISLSSSYMYFPEFENRYHIVITVIIKKSVKE
jgi:hypothetical protein